MEFCKTFYGSTIYCWYYQVYQLPHLFIDQNCELKLFWVEDVMG